MLSIERVVVSGGQHLNWVPLHYASGLTGTCDNTEAKHELLKLDKYTLTALLLKFDKYMLLHC